MHLVWCTSQALNLTRAIIRCKTGRQSSEVDSRIARQGSPMFEQISISHVQYRVEFGNDESRTSNTKINGFIENHICVDKQYNAAKVLWTMFKENYPLSSLTVHQGTSPGLLKNCRQTWLALNVTRCRKFLSKMVSHLSTHLRIDSHWLPAAHSVVLDMLKLTTLELNSNRTRTCHSHQSFG